MLVDLFESIEHFLKHLDIYTNIPLTPAMTEVLVKILVELLSTLALTTKALKQGQSSKCILADVSPYSAQHREICKRGIRWRNGYEGNPTEVGSPYPG